MIGLFFGIVMLGVIFVIQAVLALVFRFDRTNALLASVLIQLLAFHQPWGIKVRLALFVITTVLFVVLQHRSKIARALFSVFSTVSIALLGYIWIDYSSVQQQITVTIICLAAGAFLNHFYWTRHKLGVA